MIFPNFLEVLTATSLKTLPYKPFLGQKLVEGKKSVALFFWVIRCRVWTLPWDTFKRTQKKNIIR